jgi:hypothetical protein
MKKNKQTVSEQGKRHFLFIIITIIAVALFGMANFGYSEELSVDDRVKALEERLDKVDQQVQDAHTIDWDQVGNMVMFRGGGAWLTSNRSNEVFTDVFGFTGTTNDNSSGWYAGGALNLILSKDTWGMMSGVWTQGEIGVEYKRWTSNEVVVAVPSTCSLAGVPTCAVTSDKVELTMLTVSISPKLMFMEGSRFRPWIIPAGLDFHVISPPSNDTTVLDIGVQFAAGAQYRVWKALHLGLDGRFHLASGETGTTNNFGTFGAYAGIGF